MEELIDIYYKHKQFYRGNLVDNKYCATNPLCGDQVMFGLEEDVLIYFQHGCVLSNVASAIFCDLFLKNRQQDFLKHEIFNILLKFPVREKCLKLPIQAYNNFLAVSSA